MNLYTAQQKTSHQCAPVSDKQKMSNNRRLNAQSPCRPAWKKR